MKRLLRPAGAALRLLPLCLILATGAAHADETLDRVQSLIKAGAPNLALTVLERNQPAIEDADRWQAWEEQRLAILAAQKKWLAVVERVESLPSGLPRPFVEDMWFRAAAAQLSAGDAAGARVFLRRLLWGGDPDAQAQAPWREMVIRTYLADGAIDDARAAIVRYQTEFSPRSPEWSYLHARVLLRAGDPGAAAVVVGQRQTFEGRLLYLLARLRSGDFGPADAIDRARSLEKETRGRPEINRRVWALLAEAGARAQVQALVVDATEHALPVDDELFSLDADDLWQGYESLGEALGNEAQLLIGDDVAWLELAARLGKKSPLKARAIHALLANKSPSPEIREKAHLELVRSLYDEHYGRIAVALCTASRRFPEPATLPAAVRYYLSDRALQAHDVQLAARLVAGLEVPPPGEDPTRWQLRRARLAIYSGAPERGVALLSAALAGRAELGEDDAEAVLQVVFDLQVVGQHAAALDLLPRIRELTASRRLRREILFWMGESREAQSEYAVAAELYLRSALEAAGGTDMWGQAARYSAAGALAKAGLKDDAYNIYNELLAATEDPKRRAVIERNIQKLWLLGPSHTTQ
jgi:hypothetical protein